MQSCLAILCVGRLGAPHPPAGACEPSLFPSTPGLGRATGAACKGPSRAAGVVTEEMMNGWLRVSGLSCLSSCASLGIQCTGSDQLEIMTFAGKAGGRPHRVC